MTKTIPKKKKSKKEKWLSEQGLQIAEKRRENQLVFLKQMWRKAQVTHDTPFPELVCCICFVLLRKKDKRLENLDAIFLVVLVGLA